MATTSSPTSRARSRMSATGITQSLLWCVWMWKFADFHIHTHHSKDCVMPVADILERAREVGLDVVAITDHDSAVGGLEAREIADRYGVRVICLLYTSPSPRDS